MPNPAISPKPSIGACVVLVRLASNTLTQPFPLREKTLREGRALAGFAPKSPLSLGGEGWDEGVTGVWRFVRMLWDTLIQLRLVRSALKTLYPSPCREKGAVSYSILFLAISNSCRIASNTPSRLSFTSLFQNRITRNPNASNTAVRAASASAI